MTANSLTRRHALSIMAGTAATALAGCIGSGESGEDNGQDGGTDNIVDDVTAYVVNYHWGFALFDESGAELDILNVAPNTEITLYAVNDHAYDAFDALPDPLTNELQDFDALERTKSRVEAGELSEPEGGSIEEVYEEAHGHAHDHEGDHEDHGDDHGHDDHHDDHDDHGDGHDDGMLDHGFMIPDLDVNVDVPADAHEPSEATFIVEEPGTYKAICTVACGYHHGEMQDQLLRVED